MRTPEVIYLRGPRPQTAVRPQQKDSACELHGCERLGPAEMQTFIRRRKIKRAVQDSLEESDALSSTTTATEGPALAATGHIQAGATQRPGGSSLTWLEMPSWKTKANQTCSDSRHLCAVWDSGLKPQQSQTDHAGLDIATDRDEAIRARTSTSSSASSAPLPSRPSTGPSTPSTPSTPTKDSKRHKKHKDHAEATSAEPPPLPQHMEVSPPKSAPTTTATASLPRFEDHPGDHPAASWCCPCCHSTVVACCLSAISPARHAKQASKKLENDPSRSQPTSSWAINIAAYADSEPPHQQRWRRHSQKRKQSLQTGSDVFDVFPATSTPRPSRQKRTFTSSPVALEALQSTTTTTTLRR